MGENQGVIWVLIGALVLGMAVFVMGGYFSDQTERQHINVAFQQQVGIDSVSCKENNGDFKMDTTVPPDWTPGSLSATAVTPPGYALSTGVCVK